MKWKHEKLISQSEEHFSQISGRKNVCPREDCASLLPTIYHDSEDNSQN